MASVIFYMYILLFLFRVIHLSIRRLFQYVFSLRRTTATGSDGLWVDDTVQSKRTMKMTSMQCKENCLFFYVFTYKNFQKDRKLKNN